MGACSWLLDKHVLEDCVAQSLAMSAPNLPSPDRDQVQYLGAHRAHRDAQLEHVSSERDAHLVQEEKLLAHMRLVSKWKSRVVSGSGTNISQRIRRSSTEGHRSTKTMEKQFQA